MLDPGPRPRSRICPTSGLEPDLKESRNGAAWTVHSSGLGAAAGAAAARSGAPPVQRAASATTAAAGPSRAGTRSMGRQGSGSVAADDPDVGIGGAELSSRVEGAVGEVACHGGAEG